MHTPWRDYRLTKDKSIWVEAWVKKLLAVTETTQKNLEYFVETLLSTTPTVWKAPLHYRALQRLLIISLKGGRSKSRNVHIAHLSIMKELDTLRFISISFEGNDD